MTKHSHQQDFDGVRRGLRADARFRRFACGAVRRDGGAGAGQRPFGQRLAAVRVAKVVRAEQRQPGQGWKRPAGSSGKGLSSHVFEEGEGPSDEAKGPKYGGGKAVTGKPGTAGTKKGDLVSDMWIILRDENGVPILNADGFVQPVDKDGNLIPLDAEGAPIDPTLPIEVELGRTNVGRSPTKVLDKRLDEVVMNINAADSVSFDDLGRLVADHRRRRQDDRLAGWRTWRSTRR